jgi:hypothetical protein
MTTISNTYVSVRPSTDVPFIDTTNTDFEAYIAALETAGVESTITYSTDQLTKTRVETYDDSIDAQLTVINTQYAAAMASEKQRRAAAGITTTVTPTAS